MTNSGPLVIVLGPQGSGKGTQINLLKQEYGLPSVSTGELFRQSDPATDLGRRIHDLIDNGTLVTVDLWEQVMTEYLDHADLSRGYLLDGVVRTMEQESRFATILANHGLETPWVLSITLDDEEALQRLQKRATIEGRADDTESAIRSRLAWSRSEVQPVIEHYRSRGRVVEVNGDQTVEAVHRDIVTGLTDIGALPEVHHG